MKEKLLFHRLRRIELILFFMATLLYEYIAPNIEANILNVGVLVVLIILYIYSYVITKV
nr:MAG TPA: hypothetical protein [Caudoviricetes sp.]